MSKKAIVIDDDEDTVRIFTDFLEENQVEVIGKGFSGREAIQLYRDQKPDIVFIDIMMPEGSGIYAIKKIREIDPNSVIIAVTADSTTVTEEKLINLKTNAIIYKPFDIEKILQIINN